MFTIIRNFIAKGLFKKSGVIANNKSVEFSTNALIKRLGNYNIKPEDITSEDQLLKVLASVKQAEDNVFNNKFKDFTADVLDLRGNKLDAKKPILAGTQETEEEILQRLTQGNKDSLSNMRYEAANKAEEAKAAADEDYIMEVFDPEDFSKGGRAGYYDGSSVDHAVRTMDPVQDSGHKIDKVIGAYKRYRRGEKNPRLSFSKFFELFSAETFATGGRAGYYGGGMTSMVGEDLSEIGHGSDSLMARNMQLAPNGQATTSTGLNYLLGQDNDTVRIPYNEGNMVLPQPKPQDPMIELKRVYDLYTKAGPGVSQETQKYLQQDFIEKLNKANISQEAFMTDRMQKNFKAEGGRIGFKGGGADMGDEDRAEERTSRGYGTAPDTGSRSGTNDYSTTTQTQNHNRAMRDNQKPPKSNYEKTIGAVQKANDFNKVFQVAKAGSLKPLFAFNPYALGITGLIALDKRRKQKQVYEDSLLEEQTLMPYAEGGPARQGFKMGRRAFLGLMGSVGAGIAGLKTGLFGVGKKAVVKEAAKEVATGGAPAHFLKLVAKIKSLGNDTTPKYGSQPREKVTSYKDYTLSEELDSGRTTIQRSKDSEIDYYDEILIEDVYMSHTPGKNLADETTKGKNLPDEYTEDTSYMRTSGPQKGDILETVNSIPDDIFKEVGEAIPEAIRKEKADGGRIGYAGGKKVVDETLKIIKDKFGKKAITTADKVEVPKETLLRDMFTDTNKRLNLKKQMNDNEYEDFLNDIGGDNLEAYNFDGTVGDGARILKEQKKYEADMFLEYKKGNLDPVAGDKSPARKRFLEKKLEEAQMSGDNSLITYDEIEELSAFDLGTEMQTLKDGKTKSIIPENEYVEYSKDFDKEILNKQIKEGVASIMSDTSPAALEKSIEIDNLMLKYEGLSKELAEQIATEINPRKKADIIAMVEQTIKMGETGMSGDDIIQTFKNTTRTKQATGGLASIMGE